MKGKGSESSLVIVSRRVLIAGIAGISIFSFGLGYFLGYGGTSSNKLVKQVEADNKVIASEERTVLDSSGKPTMVPPPVLPGSVPKEPPLMPRQEDTVKEGTKIAKNVPEAADTQKKTEQPAPEKKDEKNLKKETADTPGKGKEAAAEKKAESRTEKKIDKKIESKQKERQVTAAAGTKKPAKKSDKKQNEKSDKKKLTASKKSDTPLKSKASRTYELQAGAFEDPAKAEGLRKELGAKGYKASVTTFSPEAGRTFSRVRIGPYKNRKEAEEALTALKGKGMESILIPGHRMAKE